MSIKKTKRLPAIFMSLCLAAGLMPVSAFAKETNLCSHHPSHDASCGYVEGRACGHTHDDECGYIESEEGAPCKHEQGDHDESCGYMEGGAGIPCDKECSEIGEDGEIVHAPDCAYTPDMDEGGGGLHPRRTRQELRL